MSNVTVLQGDCRDLLFELDDESVDAIITDPPYELAFMGKTWDAAGIAFTPAIWEHCYHILKPGGHLLAFGGTRTWHRLACAIEDAGFEIRDSIAWLYGSGFPKSLDVSKAIDKAAGAEREVVGDKLDRPGYHLHAYDAAGAAFSDGVNGRTAEQRLAAAQITAPATNAAKQWAGWGTALKPSFEPVICARKPLAGTVAANVLAYGTGALNIDGCRVGTDERVNQPSAAPGGNGIRLHGGDGRDAENARRYAESSKLRGPTAVVGRWPANVVLDDSQATELDKQSGYQRDGKAIMHNHRDDTGGYGGKLGCVNYDAGYGGGGGASRFFPTFRYTAKAPKSERPTIDGIAHPTVKPLKLMRWLVRLVTPPNGLVLDPFAGSGTTGEACILENVRCVLIENDPTYIPLIEHRLTRNQ